MVDFTGLRNFVSTNNAIFTISVDKSSSLSDHFFETMPRGVDRIYAPGNELTGLDVIKVMLVKM